MVSQEGRLRVSSFNYNGAFENEDQHESMPAQTRKREELLSKFESIRVKKQNVGNL